MLTVKQTWIDHLWPFLVLLSINQSMEWIVNPKALDFFFFQVFFLYMGYWGGGELNLGPTI